MNANVPPEACREVEPVHRTMVDAHFETIRANGYHELTRFDLLDVALRQALRIRGVSVIGDARVRKPFVHPGWLGFWFNQKPGFRLGQRAYKTGLRARYPRVFSLPRDAETPTTAARSAADVGRRALRKIRRTLTGGSGTSERGDLRKNRSKYELQLQLLRSFADRGIEVGWDVRALRDGFKPDADRRTLRRVNATATVECNIRAGTLSGTPPTRRAHRPPTAEVGKGE